MQVRFLSGAPNLIERGYPQMATNMNFNITIFFANGAMIQREAPLSKAAKLSMKENVIVPEDTDYVEVKGINSSMIIPLNMVFVVSTSPDFKHVDRVSRYMLYRRDNGRCGYCGAALGQREATIDHIIPKSQGGKTTWENVVLACQKCNSKKDNKTPHQAEMTLRVKPYNPKKSIKRP